MKLSSSINILLLGNGGRESAFAWKIKQSPRLGSLFIAPGNGGTQEYGINVDMNPLDFALIGQFILTNQINLVVVGSEEPLVKGIKDFFQEDDMLRHVPIVGPSKSAAALEGSKDFAKEFMKRHNIPTSRHVTVSKNNINEGYTFLDSLSPPYVLKANGLAAGKGVLILDNLKEAKRELKKMIEESKFGSASSKVVIEEFLRGVELSVFVATDGESYKLLPVAKDYKRIGDNDKGLNTGGMGAVSYVPFATKQFMKKVVSQIIEPTLNGIKSDNLDYKGFIFFGIINCDDNPYVIEYNVRMGDPEAETILSLLQSDIIELFEGIVHTSLSEKKTRMSNKVATTVVCTAKGYPKDYATGDGITLPKNTDSTMIFHCGTTKKGDTLTTNGGRVLAVTGQGRTIQEALDNTYKTISKINFEGIYYRKDIGQDLLEMEAQLETK